MRTEFSTYADTPKTPKLALEYNVAIIGFQHRVDAAAARVALDGEGLLRSGCLKVTFCAGHDHDITMEDELDEGDFENLESLGYHVRWWVSSLA